MPALPTWAWPLRTVLSDNASSYNKLTAFLALPRVTYRQAIKDQRGARAASRALRSRHTFHMSDHRTEPEVDLRTSVLERLELSGAAVIPGMRVLFTPDVTGEERSKRSERRRG